MNTPICDFVQRYAQQNALRLHMPGHKGTGPLGIEQLDITEIDGADSLYEASGIIRESERNAGELFGCQTYYATEGASHCVRAMLYLALLDAKQQKRKSLIAAARNVHKSFVSAAALLDLQIMWLYSKKAPSYLHCVIDPAELDKTLQTTSEMPAALYLTSPDYLGNIADIAGIARVCRKYGILLLVDNAHGAYLKFLQPSQHPIDLGADLCCDSAHKTLPVLTGGAYLHICKSAPEILSRYAKKALALFGSTSPSYLILQSLDAANVYLQAYPEKLCSFLPQIAQLKSRLSEHGYRFCGNEPMKLTLLPKSFGYTGNALAQLLHEKGIVCEFFDPDHLVLMVTPETGVSGLQQLEAALLAIPRRSPVTAQPPAFHKRERCLSIREAMLSVSETIPITQSNGRILASASEGCPPAVPILVSGEKIDDNAIACFQYYGTLCCSVVVESDQTISRQNY